MKLTRFTDPMYGLIAFGTSGRAPNLTGWPGGGYIGIHGTDKPQLARRRLTRVHPAEERRHPPARPADARRNAGHRA